MLGRPCSGKTEVYSRICGFFRPVQQWNRGQKAQYHARTPYRPTVGAPFMAPESDQGAASSAPTGDPTP